LRLFSGADALPATKHPYAGKALAMNPILLAALLGFACAPDSPIGGHGGVRAGVCSSEGPDYAERPRLSVRESQPARTLRIGDTVPALRVAEWNHFGPVDEFKEGTAFVVVFVPSSNKNIEGLFESVSMLAERFAEQPVRVLAIAGEEQRMSLEAWRHKTESMKKSIRFALGWDKGVQSRTAFLTATGEQQPTLVYVIDKHRRLAWYGPPGYTTPILNSVLAGTWNFDQVRNEIESDEDLAWIRIEIIRAQRAKSIDRMIKAGERLTTEFRDPPSLEFQEALRDDLMQFGTDMLQSDSVFDARKEPRLRAILLAAAERAAKIDRNEKPRSLALLARAQAINGDKSNALKSARKGLELAEASQPPDRDLIEQLTNDVAEYGTP